jgi:hypothetical protein
VKKRSEDIEIIIRGRPKSGKSGLSFLISQLLAPYAKSIVVEDEDTPKAKIMLTAEERVLAVLPKIVIRQAQIGKEPKELVLLLFILIFQDKITGKDKYAKVEKIVSIHEVPVAGSFINLDITGNEETALEVKEITWNLSPKPPVVRLIDFDTSILGKEKAAMIISHLVNTGWVVKVSGVV